MEEPTKGLILVTGGTGFLGAHCVYQLLEKGYKVRASVRKQSREKIFNEPYRFESVI